MSRPGMSYSMLTNFGPSCQFMKKDDAMSSAEYRAWLQNNGLALMREDAQDKANSVKDLK